MTNKTTHDNNKTEKEQTQSKQGQHITKQKTCQTGTKTATHNKHITNKDNKHTHNNP